MVMENSCSDCRMAGLQDLGKGWITQVCGDMNGLDIARVGCGVDTSSL